MLFEMSLSNAFTWGFIDIRMGGAAGVSSLAGPSLMLISASF